MHSQTPNLTGSSTADPATTLFNATPSVDPSVLAAWHAALEEVPVPAIEQEFASETEIPVDAENLEVALNTPATLQDGIAPDPEDPNAELLVTAPEQDWPETLAAEDIGEVTPREGTAENTRPEIAGLSSDRLGDTLPMLKQPTATLVEAKQPEPALIRFSAVAERSQPVDTGAFAVVAHAELHTKPAVRPESALASRPAAEPGNAASAQMPLQPPQLDIAQNTGNPAAVPTAEPGKTDFSEVSTKFLPAKDPLVPVPIDKPPPVSATPMLTANAQTPASLPSNAPKQGAEPSIQVAPDAALVQRADQDFRAERVADAPPQAAARSAKPEVARQISTFIAELSRPLPGGPVEISLSPEELGRVRLNFSGPDAAPVVALSADRPETLELLRRNIDLLAQDMRRLGYSDMSFTFSEGTGGGDTSKPESESALIALSDPEQDDEIPIVTPSQALSTTGLDIRL